MGAAIILILAIIVVTACDIYIHLRFLRGKGWAYALLHWAIPMFQLYLCYLIYKGHGLPCIRTFMTILLCIKFPQVCFCAVEIFGRIVGAISRRPHRRLRETVAFLAAALLMGMMSQGIYSGWKTLKVRELELKFCNLPKAFDGYRIAQISDLHLSTFEDCPEFISQLVERLNSLDADLVCFTGDIVNFRHEEMDGFMDELSQIKARDGVYSILGNHDYCPYQYFETAQELIDSQLQIIEKERRMGWRLLLNRHEIIRRGRDSIALVGIENAGMFPYPNHEDLKGAMKGIDEDCFKILLSHDPSFWRRKVLIESDMDLTLSGHTHAMQLKILGMSPARLRFREWGGLYRDGRQCLFVHTGTGSNITFRFGAWPEIVVITLSAAE